MSGFRTASLLLVSVAALSIPPVAFAQGNTRADPFDQLLGSLFGQSNTLDSQWQRGGRPLNAGRTEFQTRLNQDIQRGALPPGAANRLGADYDALVALEAQYGSDGRFTQQERSDLGERYTAFSERLAQRSPDEPDTGPSVAEGRAEFEARVNAALASRRITRAQATRLRSDYQAVVQLEASYARDGLTGAERDDLDARLDALDQRVGDGPAGAITQATPRVRLAELLTAVAANERSGALTRGEAADIRASQGDLARLEAVYARAGAAADDSAYLLRRIDELEARARGVRR